MLEVEFDRIDAFKDSDPKTLDVLATHIAFAYNMVSGTALVEGIRERRRGD
jgi:hypothetical protein